MAVVVTGAAGFIGRSVVATLRARGYAVVGIDRRPWDEADGERSIVAELHLPDGGVDDALASADAVLHLAGCPGVRDVTADVGFRRYRDNVLAGERVLSATPATTPVVVTSSSSVYGGSIDGRACREEDVLAPRGGYARSKAALEERCAARRAGGGLVGVVRPFTVVGEGQRPDMAIAGWLAAAQAGRPLRVLGSLDRVRDVTDVRDVAEGIVRAAERGLATTVNLGTGHPRSLRELLAAVAGATATDPTVVVTDAGDDEVPATRADTRRCAELLDLVPRTDLAAVVARQLAASRTPAASAPHPHLELV
ncbi:MAG: NAD(P)-dependent oxidoreductase [Actinobacteria bacterium]|nr:NAD(P)-dependent oxidoreductase [Actinomycetota bacterium]